MLDMLDNYLSGADTPELKEAIRHAHELFDRYGLDTYEKDFEEFLMTGDQADTGRVVQDTYDLTRSLQFKLLEEHQLIISEDARPSVLNIFLEGLLRLPDYDDPDALYGILNQPLDAMELVSECIGLVMGYSPDHLHQYVSNCGAALLQQIVRNLDQKHFAVSDEEIVFKRERVQAYNDFLAVAQIKQLKIAYLLEHGLDVGHPVMVYLNLIGQDFEEMEATYIANELVAMCLISSDANANPRQVVSEHLEKFVSDLNKITKVDLAVGELLLKLNAHG